MKVPLSHKILIAWRVLTDYERFEHAFRVSDAMFLGTAEITLDFEGDLRCYKRDFEKEVEINKTTTFCDCGRRCK